MFATTAEAKFPKRTIKLVVYTKPGGAIDVFARKFQSIAKRYTKRNIVVINKAGAGGIVALKHLKAKGKDGHMIAAVTKSNIGKILRRAVKEHRVSENDYVTRSLGDFREAAWSFISGLRRTLTVEQTENRRIGHRMRRLVVQ